MMVFQPQIAPSTIEQLQELAALPENTDHQFELINGEIVEKMPSSARNSTLAFNMGFVVQTHCRQHNLPCYISIGDGTYRINLDVVAPDFAYKTTPTAEEYPDPVTPLWVIEVISPNDKAANIRKKRLVYIEANILYWEMYPDSQSIDVYAPNQPMKTVEIDGVLDISGLLPGLTIAAKDIWQR